MFDGYWIETSPEAYLFPDETGQTCSFLIEPVDAPTNILGMPLYINYYTVHDPEGATIGWAPLKGSTKDSLIEGSMPPKDQFLEVREVDDVGVIIEPAKQNSIPAVIISWLMTFGFCYAGYYFFNLYVKSTWQYILNGRTYQN